jgi:hypothetical protein
VLDLNWHCAVLRAARPRFFSVDERIHIKRTSSEGNTGGYLVHTGEASSTRDAYRLNHAKGASHAET